MGCVGREGHDAGNELCEQTKGNEEGEELDEYAGDCGEV